MTNLTIVVLTSCVDRVEDVSRIQPDVGGLKNFQPNPTHCVDRVVFNKGKIEIRNIQINETCL